MSYKLAIFAPQIGAFTETFIRKHMEELLPGGTVVVTHNTDGFYAGNWSVTCPVLALDKIKWGGPEHGTILFLMRKLRLISARSALNHVISNFLKKHNVKVIMCEYLDYCTQWIGLAKKLNIDFFAHAHGYDISERLRDEYWRKKYIKLNSIKGIITVNKLAKEKLIELGIDKNIIHIIPCCVDVPKLSNIKSNSEHIKCLSVGMTYKKGTIQTLESFRLALQKIPNLYLDYIGDGQLFTEAEKYIASHNLDSNIKLHGNRPNEIVHKFMEEADLFIQHSITDRNGSEEGLPVAILEAMSHSLPVVATEHAGIPEAVIDGETGFLVDENDIKTMSEKIVFLARSEQKRIDMGFSAWKRAKDCFSWNSEKEKLTKLMNLV